MRAKCGNDHPSGWPYPPQPQPDPVRPLLSRAGLFRIDAFGSFG